jgi:RHS repeat-associated protein
LWCGTELCDERGSMGSIIDKRFFREGEQQDGGFDNYYYARDHLGSIREMTDSSGTTQAEYKYDPWGRQTAVYVNTSATFGFTGHYYHAPSGLDLTLYRAYNADLGRWLNRDPLGEPLLQTSGDVPSPLSWARKKPAELVDGPNLYAYVRNDPAEYGDALGLKRDCDQEHIDCFRTCYNTTPPWPAQWHKYGHYQYCQAKCLVEYMECEAENAAESVCEFCSKHPYLCAAGIIIIIIPVPKPVPI